MGNKRSSLAFHILSLVSFIITLSLNVAAIFGGEWWVNTPRDSDTFGYPIFTEINKMGLLRFCIVKGSPTRTSKYCKFYPEFGLKELWYTNTDLKPFIILILFIISTTFCLVATIITVLLLAFQRKRDFRCIGGILAAVFSFVGALAQFGGLIYGQYYENDLNNYKLGWTAVVAWVGATSLIFSSFISFTNIFMPHAQQNGGIAIFDDPRYVKTNNSSYSYKKNGFVTNY